MKNLADMSLEEKVDQLLKYQIKIQRHARVKTVISLITFMVAIVIPVALAIWAGRYIQDTLGLTTDEVGQILRNVKNLTDFGGAENIKDLFNR